VIHTAFIHDFSKFKRTASTIRQRLQAWVDSRAELNTEQWLEECSACWGKRHN
jgi:hypothetical protein